MNKSNTQPAGSASARSNRPRAIPPFDTSSDLAILREKVSHLESDVARNNGEIRQLIELAAQIRLLMSLSIGGGALSLLNLALFFINLVR